MNDQLTPDEAMASLAFTTQMQEQMMMPKEEEMTEEAPAEEVPEEVVPEQQKVENLNTQKLPENDDQFQTDVMDKLAKLESEVSELLAEEKEDNQKDDTGKESEA